MVPSVALVIWFGQTRSDIGSISLVAAAAGSATNGAIVGLYAIMAQAFPAELRATATAFVIGVGRGSSALAPALAGLLFAIGYGLPAVTTLMACGSAAEAVALLLLRGRPARG